MINFPSAYATLCVKGFLCHCLRIIIPVICLLSWERMHAQHIEGYDTSNIVKERMISLALQEVEGLWQFPSNGSVIAIERDDDDATRFRIVTVESPYLVLPSGELLGYAYPTAKRGVLDARLREILADGSVNTHGPKGHQRFTLTLNDDAIIFTPVKKGFRLSWDWWRLFPYMFRVRVSKVDDRPKNLDGAVRIWPRSTTTPPRQPRYL